MSNISAVGEVETIAWSGKVPWHGLGNNVTGKKMGTAAMQKAAGIDWTVSKQPVHIVIEGQPPILVPDQFALIRDTDKAFLSMVGSVYKPVQNEQAMDFFRKFVDAGHMTLETAGSLWGGRYVWCLARIGTDFAVGKGDEIRPYLLLMSPHVRGKAMIAQFTTVRVVCWNTLNAALGAGLKGKGAHVFRMPHTSHFDEAVKGRAEQALGIATEQSKNFQEAAVLLSKKKAKPADVDEFFCEVLRYDPKKTEEKRAKVEEAEKAQREPRALPLLRHALTYAPGQDILGAKGTWWGALNAVTFVMDHQNRGQADTALKNSWLGHKADVKRRAFDLALKRAA